MIGLTFEKNNQYETMETKNESQPQPFQWV